MDSPSTPNDWPEKAVPARIVEWLFDQMLSKWGKQFVDKWSVVNPDKLKRDWAKALFALSQLEWKRGVAKMNAMDFPPSLPEFLKACKPEVNPLAAYYEAVEGSRLRASGEFGTWSHPAIFWASVRVSAHDLQNQTYSQIRQRWEVALAAELAKDQWADIPAPMIAISGPGKDRLSREAATKMMNSIKATTGQTNTGRDPKEWAKKILQDEKEGKKMLPIQVQFARQALNKFEENDD